MNAKLKITLNKEGRERERERGGGWGGAGKIEGRSGIISLVSVFIIIEGDVIC